MELDGYAAWITVDNVELSQYGVEISADRGTISCWIPSEAGKNFTVHWRDSFRFDPVSGYVLLDGIACGGNLVLPTPFGQPVTVTRFSTPTSQYTERPFLFSNLQLTDDDNFLDQHQSLQSLGEITVEIWRVMVIDTQAIYSGSNVPEEIKVHEKSKKAIAHRAKLGDEIFVPQRAPKAVEKLGTLPLVKFVFKYRSLDVLRANGIAPAVAKQKRRASNQPELEIKPEPIDVDAEEEHEIQALQKRLYALQSRRMNSSGSASKRVKTEPSRATTLVTTEVIDLT